MTKKTQLVISGISGFTAVAIGAMGTHYLKNMIDPFMLESFKTGVLYHLIHTIVLLVIGLSKNENFNLSYYFFFLGIILFSFSLYIYALTKSLTFVMLTPFGGTSFLIGWLIIIINSIRLKNK